MYVITIIRNQHSIHTCILAACPLPASLASKTGSHVVLKIFPGTQHVQADKEASAASPAGRRLGLSCNLSVQFDNDQTTRYYNHESWRDYRHLIFELSEPKTSRMKNNITWPLWDTKFLSCVEIVLDIHCTITICLLCTRCLKERRRKLNL